MVTIEGSNLGLKEDDVKGKIRIGDIPCELIDYQVSVKIICRTGSAPTEMDAPVIIGNTAGYTESTVKYSYKVLTSVPFMINDWFGLFFFRGRAGVNRPAVQAGRLVRNERAVLTVECLWHPIRTAINI